MPNYIGYNIYICKISIILLRVYLLVICLQCNIMWKQVFFHPMNCVLFIYGKLFNWNFYVYLLTRFNGRLFLQIHSLSCKKSYSGHDHYVSNAKRKIFVCIKIRSLFDIRKEEEKIFLSKEPDSSSIKALNCSWNISRKSSQMWNHLSLLTTLFFTKYGPFAREYQGPPQDTALGEPKWLHRPGRPLPCRLHGQHPSGILIWREIL